MVLAADYPFMEIFWTMLIFFLWIVWIWMIVVLITNVFARRDFSGIKKAAWVVLLIFVPFIGVITYIAVEHKSLGGGEPPPAISA